MPYMRVIIKDAPDTQIILITGVGNAYPIVRAHTVLGSLPSVTTNIPVVLFFPGKYRPSEAQGSSLELFGEFTDDQFYRAKDITELEV